MDRQTSRFCAVCKESFRNHQMLLEHHAAVHSHLPIPAADTAPSSELSAQSSHGRKEGASTEKKHKHKHKQRKVAAAAYLVTPFAINIHIPEEVTVESRFEYRDVAYTLLPNSTQDELPASIQAKCHSRAELGKRGFPFPQRAKAKSAAFAQLPPARPPATPPRRRLVAIDCEMAGDAAGRDVLVLLSAVDVQTGATLINALVRPVVPVKNWRTPWSGVDARTLAAATARGQVLDGPAGARAALGRVADRDTVLVGCGCGVDLRVLGLTHDNVVDVCLLATGMVFPGGATAHRTYGLRVLCAQLLGKAVQASRPGVLGHDCLEDALATREVLLRFVTHPDEVRAWAAGEQGEWRRRLEEMRLKQLKNKNKDKKRNNSAGTDREESATSLRSSTE